MDTKLNNLMKYSYREIEENPKIVYMEVCGKCPFFNSECLDKNCLALDLLFKSLKRIEIINNYLKENFNISIENNFVVGSEKNT